MQYTPEENAARREALYNFLLQRGDKWTSMEQTTDSISLYPAYFKSTYHNSGARRLLTSDIEVINMQEKYEKIIVSGSKGIKLANENDFDHFIRAEFKEIFKKLKRARKILHKGSLNQQTDLEGKIREAFLGEDHG